MDPLFSPRQWMKRREAELARLAALEAVAKATGVALKPSAPEDKLCDICGGSVICGYCTTCDSVYVDGIRVPGQKAMLPFSDESEITS